MGFNKFYRLTCRSRRKLNEKKTKAHDDVTHAAMTRKIFKKIIDINDMATRIELNVNFNAMTLKLAKKFDHPFLHLLFRNTFAQGHGFDAVTVAIS